MIEIQDQIDTEQLYIDHIDQLYRDLATARGEAIQATQWRTRFQAAEKTIAKLRGELFEALRRANTNAAQA